MPSPTTKPVTRRSLACHPKHGRRIVVTIGPGDVIFLRLERERGEGSPLPLALLYDQAERRKACVLAGISEAEIAPCRNPLNRRNV